MTSVLFGAAGVLVLAGLLWCWSLTERGHAGTLLALYSFWIPWGDLVPIPAPGPFSAPSTTFGLAAASVMVLGLFFNRATRQRPNSLFAPFVMFAGLAVLTTLWSRSPLVSLKELGFLLGAIVVFLLICIHRFGQADLRKFELGTVAGGASVSAVAFVQAQLFGLSAGKSGIPRFETVGGDANATAASLLLPFAIAFGRAIDSGQSSRARAWWGIAAGLNLVGIYLTVSRGALVAAGVAVMVALSVDRRWRVVAGVALAGVVAGLGLVAASSAAIGGHLFNTSSTGRTQIWRLGLSVCERECGRGSGFGTFPELYREEFMANPTASGFQSDAFKAHNVPLQLAVETGVVGLALFLIGMVLLTRTAVRLPSPWRISAVTATISLLITSNLITNSTFKYYWLVPAYVVMAAGVAAVRPSQSDPAPLPQHSRPPALLRPVEASR